MFSYICKIIYIGRVIELLEHQNFIFPFFDLTTLFRAVVTVSSEKKRYGGHKSSFSNRKYEHSTSLSTHIWKLKDQNIPYEISWEIVGRAAAFNPATNTCRLCLLEKYLIMFRPAGASLNQNSEFFTTCRHKESQLLGKVKFKK